MKILMTRREAAEALGMKLTSFEKYVQHEVRTVVRGRLVLIPVRELERWAEENSVLR